MGLLDNHCPPPHSTPRMWLRLHLSGFGLIGRKDSALSIIHWIVACTVVCGLAARAWSVYPFEPLAQGWELLRLDFWQRERWISRCFEDWDVFQRGRKTREVKDVQPLYWLNAAFHDHISLPTTPATAKPLQVSSDAISQDRMAKLGLCYIFSEIHGAVESERSRFWYAGSLVELPWSPVIESWIRMAGHP